MIGFLFNSAIEPLFPCILSFAYLYSKLASHLMQGGHKADWDYFLMLIVTQ